MTPPVPDILRPAPVMEPVEVTSKLVKSMMAVEPWMEPAPKARTLVVTPWLTESPPVRVSEPVAEMSHKMEPAWLRVLLGLSAWLFVPALVLGVALALYARRR